MAYIGKRPVDTFPANNAVTSTIIAENAVNTSEIATNAVTTLLIADNAVTGVKIAENNITSRELAANTIATGNIADNAVDGTKIAQNSILTRHIDDGQVTTDQLGADAVTAAKLADDAVVTANIVDANVTTVKIATNAVTSAKIAQNSILTKHIDDAQVGSDQLTTDAVTTVKITDANVTAAKLASDSVTTAKITDANVTTVKIADSNITTAKIADDAVTLAKMAGLTRGSIIYGDASGNPAALSIGSNGTVLTSDGTDISWGTDAVLSTENVQDIAGAMFSGNTETGISATYEDGDGTIDLVIGSNVITATMIAQNSILTRHIDDAQVTTAQLGADAVTGAKIADDAIDSEHLVDGSIDTAHIADDAVTAAKLANTAVTAASYGSSSAIPVITVDAQGRITAASTAATSSTLTIAADSGSNDTVTVGTDTLTFEGTANEIETTVSNNKINIGLPTNVTIAGNLTVAGTTTEVSSTTINVADPLVSLATSNNSSDAVDIGIYGLYDTSGSQDLYSGLFRDASDSGKWKLFKDNQAAPTTTVNTSGTGYATATLVANIEGNVTGDVTGNLTGTASAIADNSVTSAKIVNGTIVSADIAANTIATSNIADNAIDGTKIAQNSILTKHIDDAQVTTDQLGADAVTAAKLADDAVVTANIVDANVTTAKIAADAITGAKIADDAIDSEHYTDGSIDTAHIADDQVTLAKMAGLARGKIIYGDASGNPAALALGSNGQVLKSDGTDIAWAADSGLSTEEVQDIVGGMVTGNTETGIAVTYEDGDGTLDFIIGSGSIASSMLAADSVTQAKIADDAVGADQLAANSVVSASIVNGSIVSADIADNTIATSNIADNAVDATKIASNSILTRHIDDNQITGDQLADDLVLSGTGAIRVPDGTTAQRPGSPAAGMFRYNTTDGKFEGYTSAWGEIGGGGSGSFSTDTMTGDGSDTTLTLSVAPESEDDVILFIDGVFQAHNTYSVSGTTLTFATAPANGRVVTAYTVKNAVSGSNLTHDSFSGDGSDTTFTLSITPVHENNTQVYIDGVYQHKDTYSVSGTTLTFSSAPPNGTSIEAMTMNQTDVNVPVDDSITTAKIADNAITAAKIASGTVVASDIADGTITTAKLADNSVTAAKIAAGVLTDQVAGISSAADATAITIDSSERVGIGTTSPARNLVVSSSGQTDLSILAGASSSAQLQFGDSSDDNIGQIEYNNSENSMSFFTNATERVFINSSGNVGIGTTSINGRLHSEDSTAGNWVGYFNNTGTGGAGVLIKSAGATGSENLLDVRNGDGTKFVIKQSDGKVGIGTESPNTNLFVYDASAATHIRTNSDITQSNGTVFGKLSFQGEGNEEISLRAFYDHATSAYSGLSFHYDGSSGTTEAMRINSSGNIGFGTTTLPAGMASSSYKQFKIGGGILADSGHASGHNIMLGNNVYVGASNDLKFTHAAAAAAINMTGGDINFRTHDGGGASADATASLNSRFYIKENGQIGVGTTSPDCNFHIAAGNPNNTADAIFFVSKTGSNDFTAKFGSGADDYGLHIRGTGNYSWSVYDHSAGAYRGRLTYGGDLYLQNTTVNSISDRRLKKNIVDANSQWNDIKALRWRNFEWKDEYIDGTYLGLIADEVESISPNLVEINAQPKEDIDAGIEDPEHKAVKYSIVWMKAMKALQEAQERIETLEAKVQALES